jgi:cardiolipin synthase
LTGPVVATMQQEFLNDWRLLGGTVDDRNRFFPQLAPTGGLAIRAVDQRPAENDFDINNVILIAIRSAREYIDIQAPYFNPTDELLNELVEAAMRGVRIRVLINSDVSTDISATFYMSLFWFGALLNGGVEVYLWGEPEKNMHSKALVVDGRLAMISTHNLNHRSIVWDTENGVVFTDGPMIGQIGQMVEDDFHHQSVYRIDRDWLDEQPLDSWDMLLPMVGFGWLF